MSQDSPANPPAPRPAPSLTGRVRRLPPVEWLVSYLFGDDVFISYSRRDGIKYAVELSHKLSDAGYSVRMDVWETEPGKQTPEKVMHGLRRSRNLVVVATPFALQSPHVAQEVAFYRQAHHGRTNIIPVHFGEGVPAAPWLDQVEGLPWLSDADESLKAAAPAPGVVNRITAGLRFTRRNRRLFYTSLLSLGVLVLLLGLSGTTTAYAITSLLAAEAANAAAVVSSREAERQQALAEAAGREAETQKAAADAAKVEAERQTLKAENEALEARRQTGLAEAADAQRAEAERLTERARELEERARRNAEEQQAIANSRRFSGQADRVLVERPDLSFLLGDAALAARSERPTQEARRSLLTALDTYRNLDVLLHPPEGSEYQSVGVAPNERTVITAGGHPDGRLIFWDVQSKRPRSEQEVRGAVNGMALTRDGKTLATVAGGRLILWDVESESRRGEAAHVDHKHGFTAVAVSPDGRVAVTSGARGELIFWDISDPARPAATGQRLNVGIDSAVHSLAFSPDGRTLLAGGNTWADGSGRPADGSAPFRGVSTGVAWRWDVTDIRMPKPLPALPGIKLGVKTLAFSPDGRFLVTEGTEAGLPLWERAAEPLAWNAPELSMRQFLASANSPSRYAAFSPDGKLLAVAGSDGALVVYEATDFVKEFTPSPNPIGNYRRGLHGVLFTHDSRRLVSFGADGKLAFWRTGGAPPLASALQEHGGRVTATAFAHHGRLLASGDEGGVIAVTNVGPPSNQEKLERPDASPALSLDFDPSGGALAAGYGNGGLAVWSHGGGGWARREFPVGDIQGPGADAPRHTGVNNTAVGRLVWFVHFADAGRTLMSIGPGSQVVFWDARDPLARKSVVPLPGGARAETHSAAASPDGRLLAVGYEDGSVQMLDTRERRWVALPGRHEGEVKSLAFSRDGRWLASGDDDGVVVLWQMGERPRECRRFEVEEDFPTPSYVSDIEALAFGPDAKTLAVGSSDNVVLVDADTGSSLGSLGAGVEEVGSLAFSPDGGTLAAGGEGAVTLLDLRPDSWAGAVRRAANRRLTADELRQFGGGEDVSRCPAGPKGATPPRARRGTRQLTSSGAR